MTSVPILFLSGRFVSRNSSLGSIRQGPGNHTMKTGCIEPMVLSLLDVSRRLSIVPIAVTYRIEAGIRKDFSINALWYHELLPISQVFICDGLDILTIRTMAAVPARKRATSSSQVTTSRSDQPFVCAGDPVMCGCDVCSSSPPDCWEIKW